MSEPQWGRGAGGSTYAPDITPQYVVSSFPEAVGAYFSKYFTFSGRSNRPEYWYVCLFLLLLMVGTTVADFFLVDSTLQFTPITMVAQLATLIPSFAVSARRLHDTDRSAWWLLIILVPLIGALVLLVFACQRGTPGSNRFG